MTGIRPYDPSYAARVVELANEGMYRDEIANAVGVSLADFDAWSIQQPDFAVALADADTATGAWWNRQPREAMLLNKPFRATIWAKVMAQHYGRSGHLPRKPTDKSAAKPAVRARYNIPDNGREPKERKAKG